MKIEEAIEQLKINTGKEPLTISGSATRMADYFKALSIASEALEREIGKDTNVTSKYGEWISVDDRLPEDNLKDVLVWFEYYRYGEYNRLFQTIGISYTDDGEWSGFVNGQSGWRNLRILAWMPLPNRYISEDY